MKLRDAPSFVFFHLDLCGSVSFFLTSIRRTAMLRMPESQCASVRFASTNKLTGRCPRVQNVPTADLFLMELRALRRIVKFAVDDEEEYRSS